jgi:hypothetical protein
MSKNNTNPTKKKQQGRLDWIETVEVERVEEDSTIGGGGSTTPILTKQRTTSSNDHTSDGESSTDDLAVHGSPAVVSTTESNSPPTVRTSRQKNKKNQQIPIITTLPTSNSNSDQESQSRMERNVIESDNSDDATIEEQPNRRRIGLICCCCLVLVLIAAIVGGVCGSGNCPAGRRKKASQAAITLYPHLYNDICERAVGPLTIGFIPSIGLVESVEATSVVPVCPAGDSSDIADGSAAETVSRLGRWFKVTGGDEVIRISTCNRSPIYKTTADTVVTIYEGDDCGNLTCVAANNDFCGTSSSVSMLAEKGKNYYIFVTGNKDGSASSNTSNNSGATNSFDFVLSVDHENNGICPNAIGPLSPSPLPQSDEANSTALIIPGSLRASDTLPYVMSCDSRTALDGNVWYTVSKHLHFENNNRISCEGRH